MDDRVPTIRSRELGDALRAAMAAAGCNGRDMARQLDWSTSRVSRLLSGKRGGAAVDVAAFLAVCGVSSAERERVLTLCAEQDRKGWFQQHGARLPRQLRTLIDHEDRATSISQFEAVMIPGLLQTQDYARALMTEADVLPAEEITGRVSARLARQELLGRGQPERFTFYVHEYALLLPIGGPAVQADQLHHLLRLSVRPRLTLRVVPTAIGAHAAIGGSFQLMEFTTHRPVVYLESETAAAFLEQEVEIAAYRVILERLAATALDREHSRQFVATLATRLADGLED